jgi:hypothetical protein
MTGLAQSAIKLQLENWRQSEKARSESKDAPLALFGVDFTALYNNGQLGARASEDCDGIVGLVKSNPDSLDLRVWTWVKLPYSVRCAGIAGAALPHPKAVTKGSAKKKARVEGQSELVEDIDEW